MISHSLYKSAPKLPRTGTREEQHERCQTARLDDATGRTPRFCLRIFRLRLAVASIYHSRSRRSPFSNFYLAFSATNSPNLSASTASTSGDTGDVPASCKLLVRLLLTACGTHVTAALHDCGGNTRPAPQTHSELFKRNENSVERVRQYRLVLHHVRAQYTSSIMLVLLRLYL